MSFTPRAVSFNAEEPPSSVISSTKARLGRVFSRFRSGGGSGAKKGGGAGASPKEEEEEDEENVQKRKSTLKTKRATTLQSPPAFAVARRAKETKSSPTPARVTFAKEEEEEEEEEERRVVSRSSRRTEEENAMMTAEEEDEREERRTRRQTTTTTTTTRTSKKRNNAHEYTDEEIMEMEAIVRMAKRRKMGGGDGGGSSGGETAVPLREEAPIRQQILEEEPREEEDKSPHASARDILRAYRQQRMGKKTRYASRPRGLASTAGGTSYGLLRPKAHGSEKSTLLLPTAGANGVAAVNGGTPSAKLAPPIRGNGMPTSHNVLKKRDPRIVSTPGPVSIGFAQGERSKKRSRVGEDEFVPSSVINRNISRKLDSSSTPSLAQQRQEEQTPKVDLSAVRAAKERMATQTASKILRALDKANEFRSGGATPGSKPSFTPAATTVGHTSSRLRSSKQRGLNVSFADDARTPSPAAAGAGTAPPSHRMSTPYPTKRDSRDGENEFNDVQGCDQSVLADAEYERLRRKFGHVKESFEFNEERYVPESIDEDDDDDVIDTSGKKQEDNSDSESDDAPIGFKMGPGTAQKEKKPPSSLSFGTKTATTSKEETKKEDKKKEGDAAKPPVVNLWSAEFMAKNKAHQAKVQKAIEEEEGGGAAAGAPGKAVPSPFAPTTTATAPSPFTFGIPAKKADDDGAAVKKPAAASTSGGFSFGIPSATTAAPAPTTSKPNPFLASAQKKEAPKTEDTSKQPTFHFRAPEGPSIGSDEVKPSTAKFTFAGSTLSAEVPPAAKTSTEPTKAPAPLFGAAAPVATESAPKPVAPTAPTFTFGASAPPSVDAPAATGEKSGLLSFLASTKPANENEKKEESKKDEPAKPATFSFGGGLATAPKKADDASTAAKPPAFAGFGAAAKLPTSIDTAKKEEGEAKPSPFGTTSTTTLSSPFVFGAPKPAASAEPSKPVASAPSFTFGAAKPAETAKPAEKDTAKPAEDAKPAPFTFGAAPAAAPAATGLFGASKAPKPTTVTPPATSTPASSTPFTFGAASPSAATVEQKQAEAKSQAPFTFGSSAPAAAAPAPAAAPSVGGFTFGASSAAPSSAPTFTFNAGAGGGASSAPNPFAPSGSAAPANPSPFGTTNAANPFGGSNNGSRPSSPFGASAGGGGANPFGAPAPAGGANPFGGGGGGANPFGAPAGANPFANNAGAQPQQQQSGSFGAPSNSDSSQQVVPGGRKPIRRAKRPTRR